MKLWMSLGTGFFALFPNFKKVRHNPRTRCQNCLRTRAHGRRLLMTRPWCLRRRRKRRSPRTSLSSLLSTCSTMGFGGVVSGTQLTSGIAGGWPLPMGHRLAIRYGGLHGSSAVGHGDVATMVLLGWCFVRQWIQVPASTYCGGASFCSSSVVDTALFTVTGTHSANCANDRRAFPGAALGPVFDMPVVVQRHMHCPRVSRSSTSPSWRRCSLLRS